MDDFYDSIGLSLWAMALGFYLLPTLVAWFQQHHQLYPIAALNVLLGWTLVGWVGALAWASMCEEPLPNRKKKKKRKRASARMPQHPVTHSHSDLAHRLAQLAPGPDV